jgi:DUF1680 family protein
MVKSVRTREIYGRMVVQCGDNYMSQRKNYEWVEQFKRKLTSLMKDHEAYNVLKLGNVSISVSRTTGTTVISICTSNEHQLWK